MINIQAQNMIQTIDLSENKNALLPEEQYFLDSIKDMIVRKVEVLQNDLDRLKHISNVICW